MNQQNTLDNCKTIFRQQIEEIYEEAARLKELNTSNYIRFQLLIHTYLMGIQESKPLEKKGSRSKSSLGTRTIKNDQTTEFADQLITLACIRSTYAQTYQYSGFDKLPKVEYYSPLHRCKRICQSGSPVFVCYDCSNDDHAYLCEPCFEKGDHDSHRFRVFPNNNGWRILFCRCGDEDFMKKKKICQTHVQAPPKALKDPKDPKAPKESQQPKAIIPKVVDNKVINQFIANLNQAFKILASLNTKGREQALKQAIFNYFSKITEDNLYYSKVLCEFLLAKHPLQPENTNFKILLNYGCFSNNQYYNILRNLSFLPEYKQQLLREMLSYSGSAEYFEMVLNFSGKIDHIVSILKETQKFYSSNLYSIIIKSEYNVAQIWRQLIKSNKVSLFMQNNQIMMAIFQALKNDDKMILMMLQQLLEHSNSPFQYIIACLMIVAPEMFVSTNKKPKTKSLDKLEKKFLEYYTKPLLDLSTHSQGQNNYQQLLLLLPFFSFGDSTINKIWSEMETRIAIIEKNKQRSVIKEASMNVFQFVMSIFKKFMTWEHYVVEKANNFKLIEYTKDKKFIEKVLMEIFDKNPKILRQDMIRYLDKYTQNQRHLAQDLLKKNLRYNKRKGKYYNISKKLLNNPYNYENLNVGAPLKLSQWHEYVASKVFTDTFYKIIPRMIRIAQKSVQDDIEMVKTVANITSIMSILNKGQKIILKQVTRNFIKQIPDVKQNIYYVLAGIRDRLELDIDEIEQKGKSGTKKVKLDLITEIRDKKFRIIKQRQQRLKKKWLKMAEENQSVHDIDEEGEDICHVCKQSADEKRRFVFPCNFTRNNIVSTLLKSQVTDLDINICLHKVHEECYSKFRTRNQCQICKFQINCYIPEKPLDEDSYTKNWLRTFENIITSFNLQSGKSFSSDWSTIFLTYLVYSRSFKVLLDSTQIQEKQRNVTDALILAHYKDQLQKWPDLAKQALKKAEKTVKGQVSRQSNTKKAVKSLILDLVIQQITDQPVKNLKRIQKKFREMINFIGSENAIKIKQGIPWSRDHEAIQQVFDSNVSEEVGELFKIRKLPEKASQFLKETSIKCPMCSKYQPLTWQCLFCKKKSCSNCMNTRYHCQRDHVGNGIILHLHDARYELMYQNQQIQTNSLYRNQFEEGWQRNKSSEGWQAHTEEVYDFYSNILHSLNPRKRADIVENSEDEDQYGRNYNRGNYMEQQEQQDEEDN